MQIGNYLGMKQKFTSQDDSHWKNYFTGKAPKKNIGWVYYKTTYRFSTGLYSITIKSIIDCLVAKKAME